MKYIEKKMISCQNCKKCHAGAYPHGPYAYEVTGSRTKNADNRKWRYLGKAGGDGGDRIAGSLEVEPVEGQDAYANMSDEEMKEVTKHALLGAQAFTPPALGSVRGSFVDACAEAEHVAYYDEKTRANPAAIVFIGKTIYQDYVEAATKVLDEHGVSRVDALPFAKQEELYDLATSLYTDERRSIIAMQQRSEEHYEHLQDVLGDAGIGDVPNKIVKAKSELRKLQRHQNADIKKESAGKKKTEIADIKARIEKEYLPRKQKERDSIQALQARIQEVLEAAGENENTAGDTA